MPTADQQNREIPEYSVPCTRRIAQTAIMLMIAASGLIACGDAANITPEEHVIRAKDYNDNEQFRPAIIELKNALKQTPNNVEARWLLGSIYIRVGAGESAEKELRQAVALGLAPEAAAVPLAKAGLLQRDYASVLESSVSPDSLPESERATLWALRGHATLGLGDVDAAETFYDTARSIQADEPDALLGKARVAAAKAEIGKAREWLREVLTTNPGFAPAWSLLGDIERFEGFAEAAEKAYTKAVDHRTNNAADLLNRALVRIFLKDFEGARNDLNTLKKQKIKRPNIPYIQGLLALEQANYTEAQSAFQETLSLDSRHMPAIYYLGVSYYLQNKFDQAQIHFSRFLSANATVDSAAKLLAMARIRMHDHSGAELVLEPVLRRNPKDVEALDLMAAVSLAKGDAEKGVEFLERVTQQIPESATAYMKFGLGLLEKGERDRAREALDTAIELDPQLSKKHFAVVATLIKHKEFDRALMLAEELREENPTSALPLNLIGVIHVGTNKEEEARQVFLKALEIEPGDPAVAHNMANLNLKEGDIDGARTFYKQVLERHPGHVYTIVALAELEARIGDVQKAVTHLENAVQAQPRALQPRVLLARYYLATDRPSAALTVTRDIRDIYPDNPDLLMELGRSQLAIGELTSAVITLENVIKVSPDWAEAHYQLASAYAKNNNPDKMRQRIDKVLELEPDHLPGNLVKIRLLIKDADFESAHALLGNLKKVYPQHPELLAEEGRLALRQNRPNDAVGAFRSALERLPNSKWIVELAQAEWQASGPESALATLRERLKQNTADTFVQYALAEAYLKLQRVPEAIDSYSKLLEHAPNHVLAMNNLAWLLRKDDPAKALLYAERANELAPSSAQLMDTLAMVLLDRGESKRALRLLQDAAEQTPSNPGIQYHLALALTKTGSGNEARKLLERVLESSGAFAERDAAQALLSTLPN